jgi:hypothetical protein
MPPPSGNEVISGPYGAQNFPKHSQSLVQRSPFALRVIGRDSSIVLSILFPIKVAFAIGIDVVDPLGM